MRSLQIVAILVLAGISAAQSTWYVDVNGTPPGSGTPADPYTSIQYAISRPSTVHGDTVLVLPGVYAERLNFWGKRITVRSQGGATVTTIDAGFAGSAVTFVSGETLQSVLEGFTLKNGRGTPISGGGTAGGGIYCSGSSATVLDCTVQDNEALFGGGIAIMGARAKLEGCAVNLNRAVPLWGQGVQASGGGLYISSSTGMVEILACTFGQNRVDGDGGGIYARDALVAMSGSNVARNIANGFYGDPSGGGLMFSGSGQLLVSDSTFSSNETGPLQGNGAGLFVDGAAVIQRCTIVHNSADIGDWAGRGGGIWSGPFVHVSDSLIGSNLASQEGGGIWGSGLYERCKIEDNCSNNGGGAYGQMQILTSEIRGNSNIGCATSEDYGFGGGVHGNGLAILENCLVEGNLVFGTGGGILGATAIDCEIRGNRTHLADNPWGYGGGAHSSSLTRCRIYDNEVVGAGPGNSNGWSLGGAGAAWSTLEDCDVFDNRAIALPGDGMSEGGGVYRGSASRTRIWGNSADLGAGTYGAALSHCTVFDNVGEGVRDGGTIADSIVRGNSGVSIAGAPTVRYSNVEGGFPGAGNIDQPELFWAPYGSPDGEGRDFHLRAGSPSIDAGDPAGPPDPDGSRADMGALPFDPSWCPEPLPYCDAKVNSQGCTPEVWFTGSPTLSGADNFRVRARQVLNNKVGLLLWGRQAATLPFQGGILCVGGPIVRTPAQDSGGNPPPSDCSGTYGFHFTHAYTLSRGLASGDHVHAQFWSRDPADQVSQTGLTDGLWFVICP